MPSLLGTYVAANYGRMTSLDTYGGLTYNNFGTRNLAFLKIISTGGSPAVDFTAATGPDTDASNISGYAQQISSFNPAINQTSTTLAYLDSNSYFSVAVRTLQQFGEVYMVGTPYTSSTTSAFIVAVALDTMNSAAALTNTEVFSTAYPTLSTFGALTAQLANAITTLAPSNSAAGKDTTGTAPAVTVTQIFPYGSAFTQPGGGGSVS